MELFHDLGHSTSLSGCNGGEIRNSLAPPKQNSRRTHAKMKLRAVFESAVLPISMRPQSRTASPRPAPTPPPPRRRRPAAVEHRVGITRQGSYETRARFCPSGWAGCHPQTALMLL
jgi:hypothetical protein